MYLIDTTLSVEIVVGNPMDVVKDVRTGNRCGFAIEGLTKEGKKPFRVSYFDLKGWDCYVEELAPSEARTLPLQVVCTTTEGDLVGRWSGRVSLASALEIMTKYFSDVFLFEEK